MSDHVQTPLFSKYLKTFRDDPTSLVFAPLAELYRKSGEHERALEVLKTGLKNNPTYVLGYVGLGACYLDKGEPQLAYTTLRPIAAGNRENIRLQRVYARSCEELGHFDEALETYKYLLFVNPRDKEIINKVRSLEDRYQGMPIEETFHEAIVPEEPVINTGSVELRDDSLSALDDWIKVDLHRESTSEEIDDWEMKKPEDSPARLSDELISISSEELESPGVFEPSTPVITHTLVDLYCAQGHVQKAREILEKILELNPDDIRTKEKLREVNELLEEASGVEESFAGSPAPMSDIEEEESEDQGREKLMSYFDGRIEQVDTVSPGVDLALFEKKAAHFLELVRMRAAQRLTNQSN